MSFRINLYFFVAISVAGLSACTHANIESSESSLVKRSATNGASNVILSNIDGGMILEGKIHGNQFIAAIPTKWNRDALLFAHGYSLPGTPVDVPKNPLVADLSGGLMKLAYDQGFTVAYSAYNKAGMGVETGAVSTLALKKFLDEVLQPERTFVSGGSMGGNVVMALIDEHPDEFAGALAACGVVDGWEYQLGALIDIRAIYNYFTKDTEFELPGNKDIRISAISPEPPNWLSFTGGLWRYAQLRRISRPIEALFEEAEVDKHSKAANILRNIESASNQFPAEMSSFISPLATVSLGMDDIVTTFGGMPYNNTEKVYKSEHLSDLQNNELNQSIARTIADSSAVAYQTRWHKSTGRSPVKLLVLHNSIDPLVPYKNVKNLSARMQAEGNFHNLRVMEVPTKYSKIFGTSHSGYSHCGFTNEEIEDAWSLLINWVER
jgi:pimeloyl-ACP methyl ester carboxylesterase